MIYRIGLLILLLVLVSCSGGQTINLREHAMGKQPQKIIWIQIAGLLEEHLAMLRFSFPSDSQSTSIEKSTCIGKVWNYNLFELRPRSNFGFLSQITGSKNIKGDCSDYSHSPIWAKLSDLGYITGIFESVSSADETLEQAWNCNETNANFYKNVIFWKMGRPANGGVEASGNVKFFHFQEKDFRFSEGIYYDQSCQQSACFASLSRNVSSLYERFASSKSKYIFIVRDFSYNAAIQKKNIAEARAILGELDNLIESFRLLAEKRSDLLLLITTSGGRRLDFPAQGVAWEEFEKKGNHVLFDNQSLMSSVMATGAGAEHFCGMYSEVEIFKRLLFIEQSNKFLNFFKQF